MKKQGLLMAGCVLAAPKQILDNAVRGTPTAIGSVTMSQESNHVHTEEPPSSPPRTVREIEAEIAALTKQKTAAKKRLLSERINHKEHVHALCILGELIAHHGKERIVQALEKARWLSEAKRLAVEYHYEIRPRPATKKQKATDKPAV